MDKSNEKRFDTLIRWIIVTIAVSVCVLCETAIAAIHQFISDGVLPVTFNYYANALYIADILCFAVTVGYIIYYLWCKDKEGKEVGNVRHQ